MNNGSFKAQLKRFGLSVLLAGLPLWMASASAQGTPLSPGVNNAIGTDAFLVYDEPPISDAINSVTLDAQGWLHGQLISLDAKSKAASGSGGMHVFFVQNRAIIQKSQTKFDGTFQIRGLSPGAYSFFAVGKAGVAATGVQVTRTGHKNQLRTMVASTDYGGIDKILKQNLPAEIHPFVASVPIGDSNRWAVEVHRSVELINHGIEGRINSLRGRSEDVQGVQIHLIQGDHPIAQVQTDRQGRFRIPDVEPGVYDLVAAGFNAIAVGRFEAVGRPNSIIQISTRKRVGLEFTLTQIQEGAASDTISYQQGADALMEPTNGNTPDGSIEYVGESIGYGGAAGGSAGPTGELGGLAGGSMRGRGFAGGSGAGMRRLLILGGLGVAIIAISDDNPAPASPVR